MFHYCGEMIPFGETLVNAIPADFPLSANCRHVERTTLKLSFIARLDSRAIGRLPFESLTGVLRATKSAASGGGLANSPPVTGIPEICFRVGSSSIERGCLSVFRIALAVYYTCSVYVYYRCHR